MTDLEIFEKKINYSTDVGYLKDVLDLWKSAYSRAQTTQIAERIEIINNRIKGLKR